MPTQRGPVIALSILLMELESLAHVLSEATLWYAKPRGFHPSPEADHVRDCHREELLDAWLYHVYPHMMRYEAARWSSTNSMKAMQNPYIMRHEVDMK